MKKIALLFVAGTLFLGACKKTDSSAPTTTVVTEDDVLNDFVNVIALPEYANLQVQATSLNNAVLNLNTTTTNTNLDSAQAAWRNTRQAWETCEGFLFGPVEDNNYDPNTDTWPVSFTEMDSLLASNASLDVTTVQNLPQTLRGYHPLEFILWGQSSKATADSINTRDKQYMVSLSQDILNNVTQLNTSWATSGGDYQAMVLKPGVGTNNPFATKQAAMLAIVGAMSDICNEVGENNDGGKIHDPLVASDSFQTESPFSHNSMVDFQNNIIGAQNTYLCQFNGKSGKSLSAFVATKNISLDNTIKQEFAEAITALESINVSFELALYTEPTQLRTCMTKLNTLQASLDKDLTTFIQTNVKD